MDLHKEHADVLDTTTYDDDTSPFHAQNSDFEDEDPTKADDEISREDDEREQLLSGNTSSAVPKHLHVGNAKNERRQWQRGGRSVRKAKGRARREDLDGDGGDMYEMEEGGPPSGTSSRSSRESVVLDWKKSNHEGNRQSKVLIYRHTTNIADSCLSVLDSLWGHSLS